MVPVITDTVSIVYTSIGLLSGCEREQSCEDARNRAGTLYEEYIVSEYMAAKNRTTRNLQLGLTSYTRFSVTIIDSQRRRTGYKDRKNIHIVVCTHLQFPKHPTVGDVCSERAFGR